VTLDVRRQWPVGLTLGLLTAVTAAPSLYNRFVYDDVPAIVENKLVHSLSAAPAIWSSGYWPIGLLYRPLTIQLFNLEWVLGGERSRVFHGVSILLAILTTLLVWRLATRLLPPLGAGIAAALFAVHPVHVEAIANIVGQSELLAAIFAVLAVERYLVWREQGAIGLGRRLILAGLTLLAIFSKETGYAVPLLIGIAELCRFRPPRRAVLPVFFLQFAAVAVALLIRLGVLGSVAGEVPSASVAGLGIWARAVGMLTIVPEWARLLFWPVHLQGEYGPPALSLIQSALGYRLLGAAILIGGMALLAWSRRRNTAGAVGLLWMVVAMLPVANLLAPTGIILAERTMFLPSVGAVLVVAGLLDSLLVRAPLRTRRLVAAVGILLLTAAAVRSATRATVWRTQSIFFARLVEDAPRTYRAHYVASLFYYGEKRYPEAEREARAALALYQRDAHVHEQLGQVLRTIGRCGEAIPVLAEGVRLSPQETTARSRLIECLLATGDTAAARTAAAAAVRAGLNEFAATVRRLGPAPQPR
jgi:hypothetical protein